jgi:hypothetical protein
MNALERLALVSLAVPPSVPAMPAHANQSVDESTPIRRALGLLLGP